MTYNGKTNRPLAGVYGVQVSKRTTRAMRAQALCKKRASRLMQDREAYNKEKRLFEQGFTGKPYFTAIINFNAFHFNDFAEFQYVFYFINAVFGNFGDV